MYVNFVIKSLIFIFVFYVLSISLQTTIRACTYRSTARNGHIDIQVSENDFYNLGILQIVKTSSDLQWGKMYQTSVFNWVTSWSELKDDEYFALIGGNNYNTAYWGFNQITMINTIPYGVYGVDFTGSLSSNYYVQMNHPEDFGSNYIVCSRTGDVEYTSPTTTPTPVPTPTPIPTTKVVLAPGLTASWNADAILNCKDSGYTGEWTLAPYAEDVYTPIIQQLETNGWTTLPFYYDWRKNISINSHKLQSFIDENTHEKEKINLIGHSMGGLLGRDYLEESEGRKLDSLLTVGTPNKGSALAYPPWEGGNVWNDNFIEKIALTIYLKHCGDIFSSDKEIIRQQVPSIQDLLPTYEYLQEIKTKNLYSPASSENRNVWLEKLAETSWDVKLGYLAGIGFDTLQKIQTKEASKNDVENNFWEDGKPAGKMFTTEGDGTVLLDSAILPGAQWNAVINQTHRNLISSGEGISKILEFLGNTDVNMAVTNEQANSALILIGYPATFSVIDSDGKIKHDKNNMVAIMKPKDGDYKINLLSRSNNTLFIVAQFLPNGEIKYKEYNLKGIGPKFKNLKFDSAKPTEDILSD